MQIMGVGYERNVTQWSKGEYSGANNVSTACTATVNIAVWQI
jgi:hypothetical protein